MSDFEVSGSKNGFDFGPVTLTLDEMPEDDIGAAILDEVLAREDADGVDSLLRPSHHEGGNVRDLAAKRGFTALEYIRLSDANIGDRNNSRVRIL